MIIGKSFNNNILKAGETYFIAYQSKSRIHTTQIIPQQTIEVNNSDTNIFAIYNAKGEKIMQLGKDK